MSTRGCRWLAATVVAGATAPRTVALRTRNRPTSSSVSSTNATVTGPRNAYRWLVAWSVTLAASSSASGSAPQSTTWAWSPGDSSMVNSLGTTVRSRPTTAARSSTSRRRALASSTGLTSLRKALANAVETTRSTPFSNLSRTPMPPPPGSAAGGGPQTSSRLVVPLRCPSGQGFAAKGPRTVGGPPGVRVLIVLACCGAREWRNGRRARFRSVCPKGRGGSRPPSRTEWLLGRPGASGWDNPRSGLGLVGGCCSQTRAAASHNSAGRGRARSTRSAPQLRDDQLRDRPAHELVEMRDGERRVPVLGGVQQPLLDER